MHDEETRVESSWSLHENNRPCFRTPKFGGSFVWTEHLYVTVSSVLLTHCWPLGNLKKKIRHVIFKHILVINAWGTSGEIALIWISLDFTDDQSTLVQVMAWCRQATSHYLSQCWLRSVSPYGVTRPQGVKRSYRQILYIQKDVISLLIHWVLRDVAENLKVWFSNSLYRMAVKALYAKLLSEECQRKSILVQVMAWCLQATSHYPSQCRPRSMSSYDIIRQQWVNGTHLPL